MALINCPECGREISDKAIACPHCGCPIAAEKEAQTSLLGTLSNISSANERADTFFLFSANKEFVNLECARCTKVYQFKRILHFSKVTDRECIPNKKIDCPNCGNACPANVRIRPKGETAYVSNDAPRKKPTEVRCPKCGSTQIQAGERGFDAGSALVGGLLFGALGLLFGAPGKNNIQRICLNCKHQF